MDAATVLDTLPLEKSAMASSSLNSASLNDASAGSSGSDKFMASNHKSTSAKANLKSVLDKEDLGFSTVSQRLEVDEILLMNEMVDERDSAEFFDQAFVGDHGGV